MTAKEPDRREEGASAKRELNSLDRLRAVTKAIIQVPKAEIDAQQQKLDRKKRRKTK